MSRPCIPTGPIPARIVIVGEAPGSEEERTGSPFMGASGNELTKMLSEAGINRNECFLTNVVRIRPAGNDIACFIPEKKSAHTSAHIFYRDKKVMQCVIEGVELLKKEILLCKPNLIIALGNTALWALTGKSGIMDWRGSVLESDLVPGTKVIPTYHPAAILRQWSWRPTLVHDLRRCRREALFPEIQLPAYNFILSPTFHVAISTLDALLSYANGTHSPAPASPGSPIPSNSLTPRLLAMDGTRQLRWSPIPATNPEAQPSRRPVSHLDASAPNPALAWHAAKNGVRAEAVSAPGPHPRNHRFALEDASPPPGPRASYPTLCQSAPASALRTPTPLPLSVDIETRLYHITCIGIAWSSTEAICIPLTSSASEDGHYWREEEESRIVFALYRLLTHPNVSVIGQNFPYDGQYIWKQWKFLPNLAYDTMLTQHTLFPSGGSGNEEKEYGAKAKNTGKLKSLDYLASLYCKHYRQWKGEARDLWNE